VNTINTKATINPKSSKNRRIRKKEKSMEEAGRRLAELLSKQAGKKIEDLERSRRKSEAVSIEYRIKEHLNTLRRMAKVLPMMKAWSDNSLGIADKAAIKEILESYNSIRYDFCASLKIDKEKFEKLFPKRNLDFNDAWAVSLILVSIIEQETQMLAYLKRFFI